MNLFPSLAIGLVFLFVFFVAQEPAYGHFEDATKPEAKVYYVYIDKIEIDPRWEELKKIRKK